MASCLGLPNGFTVLHAACHVGNEEVVDYLLANHVRLCVDELNSNGGDVACGQETRKDKPMLDLNERDVQGRTALHTAADQGHIEVIKMLKKAYDTFQLEQEQMDERERMLLVSESDISDDDDHDGTSKEADKMEKNNANGRNGQIVHIRLCTNKQKDKNQYQHRHAQNKLAQTTATLTQTQQQNAHSHVRTLAHALLSLAQTPSLILQEVTDSFPLVPRTMRSRRPVRAHTARVRCHVARTQSEEESSSVGEATVRNGRSQYRGAWWRGEVDSPQSEVWTSKAVFEF